MLFDKCIDRMYIFVSYINILRECPPCISTIQTYFRNTNNKENIFDISASYIQRVIQLYQA